MKEQEKIIVTETEEKETKPATEPKKEEPQKAINNRTKKFGFSFSYVFLDVGWDFNCYLAFSYG